jgi:hypothetical protein
MEERSLSACRESFVLARVFTTDLHMECDIFSAEPGAVFAYTTPFAVRRAKTDASMLLEPNCARITDATKVFFLPAL